jgi:GTP-binding protein
MFIDRAELEARAGDGGRGAVSFRREKYVPLGGPDGGDGGRGGDVAVLGAPGLVTLISLQHRTVLAAGHGEPGRSKNRHGRRGADLEVPVPLGTEVWDAGSGERLGEVLAPGERLRVARGGEGGRGNARFATSTRQAPRFAERGEPGEARRLRFELRVLADVGLAGMPNAGKSTLLGALSAARPKVGPYPFTTLEPQLGVLRRGEREAVLADIPGLIAGASEGRGLGSDFLRHVSRCRRICLVVDGAGTEGRDPVEDVQAVLRELALYSADLATRPRLLVANKADLPASAEHWPRLCALPGFERAVAVSGATGEGVEALGALLLERVAACGERHAAEPAPPVVRPDFARELAAEAAGPGAFRLRGRALERLFRQADLEHPEAQEYLLERMLRMGVPAHLRRAGAREGDRVTVAGWTFPLGEGGMPLLGAEAGPEAGDEA